MRVQEKDEVIIDLVQGVETEETEMELLFRCRAPAYLCMIISNIIVSERHV